MPERGLELHLQAHALLTCTTALTLDVFRPVSLVAVVLDGELVEAVANGLDLSELFEPRNAGLDGLRGRCPAAPKQLAFQLDHLPLRVWCLAHHAQYCLGT